MAMIDQGLHRRALPESCTRILWRRCRRLPPAFSTTPPLLPRAGYDVGVTGGVVAMKSFQSEPITVLCWQGARICCTE